MLDQGLGAWPSRRARMTPDKPALVQAGRVTTYAELEHRSTRLALGLRRLGVSRADRVAFLGLNCVELVETMFAVAKLGAVFLPVNTRLAPPELRHVLEDSGARLLIWQAGFDAAVGSPQVAGLELDRVRIDRDDGGLAVLFGP